MKIAPQGHAKLSASSCNRWWNCPGSIQACEPYENSTSKYAAEGTVAHEICAEALVKNWTYKKVCSMDGEVIEDNGYAISVNQEMLDHVWTYVKYVRSITAKGDTVHVEKKVFLDGEGGDMFGTCDCVIISPFESITVIDFKYGAGVPVSAHKNKQLMYYGLGNYLLDPDVDEINLVVVQPRVSKDNPVDSYTLGVEEMETFKKDMDVKRKEASKPHAPLKAGSWCKSSFCPHLGSCKTAVDKINEIAKGDFQVLPDISRLSNKDLSVILSKVDYITHWVKAVKGTAQERIIEGEEIPGFTVEEAFGNRTWIDPKEVSAELLEYGDTIFEPAKLLSPSKMEKIVPKGILTELWQKLKKGYKLKQKK